MPGDVGIQAESKGDMRVVININPTETATTTTTTSSAASQTENTGAETGRDQTDSLTTGSTTSTDSVDSGVQLMVNLTPSLVKTPVNQVSYEKDDVLFHCQVSGRPEPEVKWYKNGDLIIQSEYFQVKIGANNKAVPNFLCSDCERNQSEDPGPGQQ